MELRSWLTARGKQVLAQLWPYFPNPVRRKLIRFGSPTFLVTVGGVVVNAERELLLLKHRFVRTTTGAWDLPSGVVQRGENPAAALVREIREETGLDATIGQLLSLESTPDNWLHFCYVCFVEETLVRVAHDEIVDFRWVPLEKPLEPFTRSQSLALEALAHPNHFFIHYITTAGSLIIHGGSEELRARRS